MCIGRESITLPSKIPSTLNFKFSTINSAVYILHCLENLWNETTQVSPFREHHSLHISKYFEQQLNEICENLTSQGLLYLSVKGRQECSESV